MEKFNKVSGKLIDTIFHVVFAVLVVLLFGTSYFTEYTEFARNGLLTVVVIYVAVEIVIKGAQACSELFDKSKKATKL